MIFKNISSVKYRLEFKLLTCLVILSFAASLGGCAATETLRVKSENLTHNLNYQIVNVIMKDGKVIDLNGKYARFAEEWDNKKNVILYTAIDTVWISEKSYKISNEIKIIELDKVSWVTLEKTDEAVEVTVTTKNGNRYKGELLSVTDKKVSLSNKRKKNNVIEIEKDSLDLVLIHGDSKIIQGLYGFLIAGAVGAGFGALVGYSMGDDEPSLAFWTVTKAEDKALFGGVIGSVIGGLIGLIVGISNSTPDKTIAIFSDDDYNKLKRYSKYPSYETLIYKQYEKEEK